MSRLRVSRPIASVPNQCLSDMPSFGWPAVNSFRPYGANAGPNTAMKAKVRMISSPKNPSGLRRISVHACDPIAAKRPRSGRGNTSALMLGEATSISLATVISSRVADPRVEPCITDIDRQVQHDDDDTDVERHRLDDLEVLVEEFHEGVLPEPRQRED